MRNALLPVESQGNDYAFQSEERGEGAAHEAAEEKDALTITELTTMLDEIRYQPNWRRQANKEADYYDGNQLDSETLEAMEELGMAPIVENLVGPTIDAVLGLEAKTRLDWRVTPSGDEKFKDIAEAINVKLNEAERESRADRACSDAYAGQIKTGLHWVEVSREPDPFKFPYRARSVHRNELFWDWKSKEPDLADARWLLRRQWFDEDVLALSMPEHAELLKHISTGWADFDPALVGDTNTGLFNSQEQERQFLSDEGEWRDTGRRRLCVYEVWYRRWVRGYVMKVPGGGVIEYNREDQRHVEAVVRGLVQVSEAVFSKIRTAWFVGPHRLRDEPSPYKHGKFPYVPFFGKREDLTSVPYGLIRPMISMQDEVNARNSKMVWLLSAKRVIATEGIVRDKETARREVARPDAWIDISAQAPANARFQVESDFALNSQQYQALVDKREGIKNVSGVYNAMMGREGNVTSGIALNSLVEQGTQVLAEINDNYRYSRSLVGELLMSLVIEDIGEQETQVDVVKTGAAPRSVTINQKAEDEAGNKFITNNLQRAKLKVALSDVPSTPSYRMQRMTMLTEITKSLPPEIQGLVIDFVMASTDLPERDQIVDRLRSSLNLQDPNAQQDPNGLPQNPRQLQQMIQQAVEQALQQANMQMQERQMALKEKDADTRRMVAEQRGESEVLKHAMSALNNQEVGALYE